jgi:hypothetical protein
LPKSLVFCKPFHFFQRPEHQPIFIADFLSSDAIWTHANQVNLWANLLLLLRHCAQNCNPEKPPFPIWIWAALIPINSQRVKLGFGATSKRGNSFKWKLQR